MLFSIKTAAESRGVFQLSGYPSGSITLGSEQAAALRDWRGVKNYRSAAGPGIAALQNAGWAAASRRLQSDPCRGSAPPVSATRLHSAPGARARPIAPGQTGNRWERQRSAVSSQRSAKTVWVWLKA